MGEAVDADGVSAVVSVIMCLCLPSEDDSSLTTHVVAPWMRRIRK